MELISRITVRRHEMGEEGSAAASKSLAIFRVLGKSPDRAMKVLDAEMGGNPDRIMVLSLFGSKLSEDEKHVCAAALAQGTRQAGKMVFCGGDPRQIFGKLAGDGKSPQWFPSIPSFVSSHEADGGRPAAKPAR